MVARKRLVLDGGEIETWVEMVLGRFRSHGHRLVDELSSIKKLMSLRYSMLASDGLADCGGYGAFGTIAKVTHIDHPSGRFSTGKVTCAVPTGRGRLRAPRGCGDVSGL